MTLVCHGEVQYPLPNKGNEVIIRPRPPKQPAPPKSAILQIQADSATTEQQAAAADIAGTWKGYSVRRKLASEELYAEHCRRHAMVIQCFVRKWQARARFLALRAARDEQITHTVQTYNHTRLLEIRPAANWQKRQFEQAARVIQAVYKWYREKRDAEQRGDDKNEVPYPLRTRRKSALLPYRRKTLLYRSRCVGRGSADHSLVGTPHTGSPLAPQRPPPSSAPAGARRPSRSGKDTSLAISSTSLPGAPHMGDISHMPRASSVSDNRQPQQSKLAAAGGSGALTVRHPTSSSNELALVPMQAFGSPPSSSSKFRGPPTQDEVEDTNANMRRREQAVRELLASPPQQERIEQKRHGIEEKDFDHCAAILQRRFRTVLAKQEVHSRLCRTEYFDRYATIMQCAFRTFLAKRRAAHLRRKVHGEAYLATRRYELQQVDTISEEHSWNAHVMNAAARILQTAFRRFYARKTWKEGKTSAHKNVDEYLASSQAPPALPLGLLKDCPPHKKTAMISRTDNSAIQRKPMFRRHYSRQGTKVPSQAAEGQEPRVEQNDVNTASEQEQQQQPIESDAAGRRSFTDEERDAAALKIQSAFRQHEARMVVERKRVERRAAFEQANLTDAARTIQAAHRRKHNNGSALQNATTPPTGSTPCSSSSVTPAVTALASAKPATTPTTTTTVTVAATGGVTVSASSSNSSPQQPAPPTTSNTQDPAPHHDAAPAHASEMITMTEDEKEHLQDLMDEAMADRPSPQTGAGGEPSPVAEGGDPYEEL